MIQRSRLKPAFIVASVIMTTSAYAVDPMPTTLPANLPDPLVMNDGTPVRSIEQWQTQRRGELLRQFTQNVYGVIPPPPGDMTWAIVEEDRNAMNGLATRRQVVIHLNGKPDGPHLDLLLYIPNGVPKPPVVFGLNFWGNQAVSTDPKILLPRSYVEEGKGNPFVDLSGVKNHRATEATRGIDRLRWPVEQILRRGFAFATAYRCDLDPDVSDDVPRGVRWFNPDLQNRPDNFSAIGAWAWGLMRGMDYLQADPSIDPKRVVAFGWSRLGKAALWAVANDQRFAGLISSESGSGGTKLFHHDVGENIERLSKVFPHWYCQAFRQYAGRERQLPFDMHEVLALIAPRPVYIASSQGDAIFDPPGEFGCLLAAEPVYALFGIDGLPKTMPPIDHPMLGVLSYHWRTGGHDVLPFDWDNYLTFCERQFGAH